MAREKSPLTSSPQLGLDFELTPGAVIDQAPGLTPEPVIGWRAPVAKPQPAWTVAENALAIACSIQNAPLARSLLALPQPWNLNEPFDPAEGPAAGHHAPLAHLLTYGGSHYGRRALQDNEPILMDEISAVALLLVERGADFLIEDATCMSALTVCAQNARQDFIEALEGHPDFTYERLAQVRVGQVHDLFEFDEDHDEVKLLGPEVVAARRQARMDQTRASRTPLLGHLIITDQLIAVRSLVLSAGFPLNELDPLGQLPLGYCRSSETLDALLNWGADPALVDRAGFNAMAKIQQVSETSVRDKMVSRVAQALRGKGTPNGALMATLQAQNIAALLEAAERAPKSSLLKLISAFKFDVKNVCDPKTLDTPLMAAFRGGRLAAARYLLEEKNCDINRVNAAGLSAGVFMLAGSHGSSAPKPAEMARKFGGDVDLSIRSARGWPVVMEACYVMGETLRRDSSRQGGYQDEHLEPLQIMLVRGGSACDQAWLVGPDGQTMMEAYAQGYLCQKSDYPVGYANHSKNLMGFLSIYNDLNLPRALDGVLAAALTLCDKDEKFDSENYGAGATMAALRAMLHKISEPCPAAALVVKRPGGQKILARLSGKFPALGSLIEAGELQNMNLGQTAVSARKGARL